MKGLFLREIIHCAGFVTRAPSPDSGPEGVGDEGGGGERSRLCGAWARPLKV